MCAAVAYEKHTFNCRIVLVHKVALYQLDRQARLSYTTSTDNDELILAQKLQK
jgi:hypothetical protein